MFIEIQKTSISQNDIYLDRNVTDALKFIACLMVAMSHYSGYVLANDLSSNIIYKVIAATGGYLGVAIYFFLSGFGLMKSEMKHHLSPQEFIKRRLVKTWLPAVLVSAIWLGIAWMVDLDLLCNQHYFLGVLWRFNDEVMWFVQTIIIMYGFFCLYRIAPTTTLFWQLIKLIIFGSAAYWTIRLTGIGSSLSVPLFFLGMAVAEFPELIKRILNNVGILVVMGFVAIVLLWLFRHDNYLMHGWGNYVSIILMLLVFTHYNITIRTLPKWLGSSSYDVYLVHYKTHLFIVHYMTVDVLWMFLGGTALVTFVFYKLRKLLGV